MKVIKYKKPLFESFDFDDIEDSIDDIKSDIFKSSIKYKIPEAGEKIFFALYEFVKNNYGNPEYFENYGKYSISQIFLENDYRISIFGSSISTDQSIIKFSKSSGDLFAIRFFSINDNEINPRLFYDNVIENFSKQEKSKMDVIFPNNPYYAIGPFVSFISYDGFLKTENASKYDFSVFVDILNILERIKSQSYPMIPKLSNSYLNNLNSNLKPALHSLIDYIDENDLLICKEREGRANRKSYSYDCNFKKLLKTNFLKMKSSALYFSKNSTNLNNYSINKIEVIERNKLSRNEYIEALHKQIEKFNFRGDQFLQNGYYVEYFEDLINKINQVVL